MRLLRSFYILDRRWSLYLILSATRPAKLSTIHANRLGTLVLITSLVLCRSKVSSRSSSFFGDLLGQRYLTVASRQYGNKIVVAVSVVRFALLLELQQITAL